MRESNMTNYPRPFIGKHLGKRPRRPSPRYPYPADMLRTHDVFEILVMDGGAFFFTNQHLGACGTQRFIEAFESGELLAPWTAGRRGPPSVADIDWFAAFDPEQGPWAPGQRIEQHVWLHRLYFLLPLAQQYFRTGDRRWARFWYEFFMGWRRRFPAMGMPPPAPAPRATAYIWHDMQATWRLLALLHSVFLLGRRERGGALSAAEWADVYRAIFVHARWVHAEAAGALERDNGERRHVGNHFLQKGTALICAAAFFPEFEGSSAWLAAGRRVVRAHARRDIYADGGSVEASPSYSHFIAGLHLLAQRALAVNGLASIAGLTGSLRRQYAFLEGAMSPAGRTLQVGDSYALDARKDLSIVRRLFPLPALRARRSRIFAASRLAVLRSERVSVFIDAMDVCCGHIHAAKPNVLVYCGERPVVVDGGCVNYDRPEWRSHFRGWPAHNVVTPRFLAGDPAAGRAIELRLEDFSQDAAGGAVGIRCRVTEGGASYAWRRDVVLRGDRLEIRDRVKGSRAETFTLWWHLAEHAEPCVEMHGQDGKLRWREMAHDAVDENNRVFRARTLLCRQSGSQAEFRTVFAL